MVEAEESFTCLKDSQPSTFLIIKGERSSREGDIGDAQESDGDTFGRLVTSRRRGS